MIRRTFMGISLMSILNLGNSKEISKENKASKALVIYFSRNGMNYWHGETKNLSVGNTARMAKVIQEATSADVWEIQPVHSYPFDYRQTTAEAQKEQEVDARPEIKLSMPDLAQYDLIFFGHPIWWSEMPMVARTFLDKADLSGKKIAHFCTQRVRRLRIRPKESAAAGDLPSVPGYRRNAGRQLNQGHSGLGKESD